MALADRLAASGPGQGPARDREERVCRRAGSGSALTDAPGSGRPVTGGRGADQRVAAAGGRVEVAGLTWRPYGRREPVLRDLHLSIPAGQRVLLAGPSGAGKSTLLRALGGLLETADSGERSGTVTIDGMPAGQRAGMVGMVLQEPGAGIVAATVGRDLAIGPENVGLDREAMPGLVADALRAVRLDKPADTPTSALSGGQTQRLAIAGALALGPRLLLLDEPTAMLDPDNAATVRRVVDEVTRARSLTTVVVEHRLGPWLDLVDRLLVLGADGGVVADGTPTAVLRDHGERLAAQGIWVPGVPDPEPLALPVDVLTRRPADGRVLRSVADLRVERATRTLTGEQRTVVALDGATAVSQAGRTTALVGPSGAGKSTLLLALAGLVDAAAGEGPAPVRSSPELARQVAWVPQWSSSTIVARTVLDEALVSARATGLPDDVTRPRALALLDALGLGELLDADPRRLSGGEQRRLAMAAAVVHEPATLLADEPTVGQDRVTWAAVMGVLEGFRAAGGGVVVSTHDDAVVARAAETVRLLPPPAPTAQPTARRPLVSHCGPLALIAASLLGIPAGVVSPSWRASLLVAGVMALVGAIGLLAPGRGSRPRGRVRHVALRMVPAAIGAVSVGWSTWLLGGHDLSVATTAGMRVVLIVLPAAFLLAYLDPDVLGDQLAQRLRMPARPVVALAAALQRVNSFGAVWEEISRARRVRGIGGARTPRAALGAVSALTIGLLVRALGEAAQLAVAMDARGFATAQRRTWYAAAPWRWSDLAVVLAWLTPVAVAVALA